MSKRKCKFTEKLATKYKLFVKGRNEEEAKCVPCDSFVSVGSKGAADLEKHISTEKHKKSLQASSSCMKLDNFFVQKNSSVDFKLKAAEGTLAYHTVSHHQSYRSLDCTSSLLKKIIPDSEITAKFGCGRTKTEAIVNHVLSPHAQETLISSLNSVNFYGIGTDASNHGATKMFPVVVQYFQWFNGIQTQVLELSALSSETAEAISKYLITTIKKFNITSKCIAFSGDNANVNFGGLARRGQKNVLSNMKQDLNSDIVGIGCPAHILHNCIQHGADSLQCDVDYIIFKIFNYFSIYTVRTEALKEFCNFVEISYQPLLYHSKTRWLSMFPAIERILKLYPALKSYFESQQDCPAMLRKFFESEFSEMYLWLLDSTMHIFHVNVALIEKENISILEVQDILASVLTALQGRLSEQFIPLKVRSQLNVLREKGLQKEVNDFKEQVWQFYTKCIDYLEKWAAPLAEFNSFQWMLLNDTNFKFNDILPCIEFLSKKGVEINDTKLIDEIILLKDSLTTKIQNEEFLSLSLDKKWSYYFKQLKHIDLSSELLKICEFYFAIPAHNAAVERIFSLIAAQWTKERNRLSIESIKSLIVLKFNLKMSCEEYYNYLWTIPIF
ncbi:uncharacterized protein LOC115876244 [Sitophilus oryzae]|uniref:Uncharacterized protein LOC115876244 n=1 Tax=Sitophilus oryzae TaxID=7048 RepID=A0A6J2X9B6_SITOR|nr:uncharacterized protein LOC115876244 [Sitophilus oryzae]